jgi:hypothetical protein
MAKPEQPIWHVLDRSILAVATARPAGGWGAYIGIVPGRDHSKEYQSVLNTGTKLKKSVAVALFPELAEKDYAF